MSISSTASLFLLPQAILGITTVFWHYKICDIVPEPYLDEVFHIRQAQAYLHNRWHIWDPKITTPPGLYLVSYVQNLLLEGLGVQDASSPLVLRSINVLFGGVLLLVLVRQLLLLIQKSPERSEDEKNAGVLAPAANQRLGHTALNICLFPPLFFFYGLYYTDILSAFSVLFAYRCYRRKEYVKVIFAGLASLLFRQTNVFWVAVFLGGLEVVRTLPRGRPDVEFPRRATYHDMILGSWKHVCLYDPLVGEASFDDYIKTIISLAITTVLTVFTNPITMFWSLSSYVLVLLAFIEFVFWNGGVVLGDKENHIASLHLAQMLYIWPYFLFFSLPLLAPYLLHPVPYHILQTGSSNSSKLPRITIALPILAVMLAIVHYNTIVHPFTLADNRHYMFYVFRILLRHPILKYLAVPVYFICAWVCLAALGGVPTMTTTTAKSTRQKTTPRSGRVQSAPTGENRASFLLIWLLTTALSLCTAPLVEPRYVIVPWLIWRMHIVPHPTAVSEQAVAKRPMRSGTEGSRMTNHEQLDAAESLSLLLETAWFLLVNFATGYIFLYWGFEWPQEPGRVQRFLW